MAKSKTVKTVEVVDTVRGIKYTRRQLVNDPTPSLPAADIPTGPGSGLLKVAPVAAKSSVTDAFDAFANLASSSQDPNLVAARSELRAAEDEIAAAQGDLRNADSQLSDPDSEYGALNTNRDSLAAESAVVRERVEALLTQLSGEAERIYVANGVPSREAKWYSKDMRSNALGKSRWTNSRWGNSRSQGNEDNLSVPRFKVKSKDPNHPTQIAAAAAAKDTEYQSVLSDVKQSVKKFNSLSLRAREVSSKAWATGAPLLQDKAQAEQRLRDAHSRVKSARTTLEKTESRVQAGVPADAVRHDLNRTFTEDPSNPTLVRNPDGSTNAWVWLENHDGSDGRYERVTGVDTQIGMGPFSSNVLVTQSGQRCYSLEHYAGRSGTRTTRYELLVAPATPGAKPLSHEGSPGHGWHVFIDSSD